nr:MAG TPA: hypothetical protein [Caudoviricetes sp.]
MDKYKVIIPDNLGKTIKQDPVSEVWDVNVDGTTVKINEHGQLYTEAQGGGGLDCAAIDELPIKPWKKDTVVLAKQDGECIRLKPNADIFTDLAVNLAASKQSFEIGKGQSETVNLVATVTNAGTNPAKEVFVTLTRPQLGTYQIGTPTTNNIGEEKTGELTWKVPTMASGKALVITLPVTLSTVGSFSFGLQATSTIDTDTTNNTKTFTFAVTAKNEGDNTNYVPEGTECPLIVATDLTHNQRLNVFTTGTGENFKEFGKYINVFADGQGFAGKQIKLEGASTVVVTSRSYQNSSSNLSSYDRQSNYNYSNQSSSNSSKSSGSSYSASQGLVIGAAGFVQGADWNKKTNESPTHLNDLGTFDPQTQIFTFHSNLKLPTRTTSFDEAPYHCVLWCRPSGAKCRWQGIPIILGIKDRFNFAQRYTFTKVKGNMVDEASSTLDPSVLVDPDYIKAANFVGGDKPNDLIATKYGLSTVGNEVATYHVVTVTTGQEAEFTVQSIGQINHLPEYLSTGKVRTSYDKTSKTLTVIVAADATPTDSIYWEDLKIIVK